jgi:hypothetical protein
VTPTRHLPTLLLVACGGALELPTESASPPPATEPATGAIDAAAPSAPPGFTPGEPLGTATLECAPWALPEVQYVDGDSLRGGPLPEDAPMLFGHGPGVALGDVDGDGWLDAIVPLRGARTVVLRNDGAGLLVLDPAAGSGAELPAGVGVALADLDADGDLDAVLSGQTGDPDRLLLNDGTGQFTVAELAADTGEHATPTLLDVDGDGDLDVFIAGYMPAEDGFGVVLSHAREGDRSSLHLQTAPGEFADASDHLPAELHPAFSLHAGAIDHDADGDLDLYVANDFGFFAVHNQLLVNDGAGSFSLRTSDDPDYCWCEGTLDAMGAQVGDLDGDADADLHVANIGDDQIYLNEGHGVFVNASAVLEAYPQDIRSRVSWAGEIVDLDLDGDEDLVMAVGPFDTFATHPEKIAEPDYVLLQAADGSFADVSEAAGFASDAIGRGLAIGDLDRDGRPDVVVAELWGLRMHRGAGGCLPAITLTLSDGPGNAEGIGARVDVTQPDGRTTTRWMLPSTTWGASAPELYLSSSDYGETELSVTFLDGTTVSASARPGDALHLARP